MRAELPVAVYSCALSSPLRHICLARYWWQVSKTVLLLCQTPLVDLVVVLSLFPSSPPTRSLSHFNAKSFSPSSLSSHSERGAASCVYFFHTCFSPLTRDGGIPISSLTSIAHLPHTYAHTHTQRVRREQRFLITRWQNCQWFSSSCWSCLQTFLRFTLNLYIV